MVNKIKEFLVIFSIITLNGCSSTSIGRGACESEAEAYSGVSPKSWETAYDEFNYTPISSKYYYDINVRRLPSAVESLALIDIKKISNREAVYFNHHYKKEKGMTPYLVRALFSNYTGNGFVIGWSSEDKVLMIRHSSLGGTSDPMFAPIIINLPEQPKRLILSRTFDM